MLLYNDDLRRAHFLKEWFQKILNEKRYSITRKEFYEWLEDAETCDITKLTDVAKTYFLWY